MRIYLLLSALTVILYVDRTALSLTAVAVSEEFGLSPVAMGYLLSSFSWLYFMALIPAGHLVGRFGAYRVGGLGIGLLSAASASIAFSWSFLSLLACRLAAGLCAAVTYPTGARTIRDHVPRNKWGLATGILHSGSLIGPAIGAVTLSGMISTWGWRAVFIVAGAIGAVWLGFWVAWNRHGGRPALPARPARPAQVDAAQPVGSDSAGLRGIAGSAPMRASAFAHGCAGFSTHLFLAWLPSYLQKEQSLPVTTTGLLLGATYLGAALLVVAVLRLSDAFMPANLASGTRKFWVAACLFGSALVAAVPYLNHLVAIVPVITLSLAACASAVSLNLALANDLTRDARDVGSAVGFISTVGNIFGLVAPIVTGYIVAETGSFNLAFTLSGALLAAGAVPLLCVRSPAPAA